jgi:alkanesulfonate monooxygenase SsuD/methylene tetrahydromethanopterin reductase-like flavin-dependent oxidoreductase (luciferase family)
VARLVGLTGGLRRPGRFAVKLGIGLPNTMAFETARRLMLDWARLADEAGFHTLGTIDKPAYDSWDPLVTLAGAAGATERARLATTILQLPNRNETLVAKQAAVVDHLSDGRLDLGVAQGGGGADYEVFGASPEGRSQRLEDQVARMRELWENARTADRDHGVTGPAPLQDPLPVWVGASRPKAIERAVRVGDGFLFGTRGAAGMAEATPWIRELAAAEGKRDFTVGGLAYAGVGDDPAAALEEAAHHAVRYYGELQRPPEELIHHGPPEKLAEEIAAYARSGIDQLIVFPLIPRLDQVERLAESILPAYL